MKKDLWNAAHFCVKCSERMGRTRVRIQGMFVRAWNCARCKETVLHAEDAQIVLMLSKLRQGITVRVGRLGKALVVRLPKEVAEFYGIRRGEDLILKAEDRSSFAMKVA